MGAGDSCSSFVMALVTDLPLEVVALREAGFLEAIAAGGKVFFGKVKKVYWKGELLVCTQNLNEKHQFVIEKFPHK